MPRHRVQPRHKGRGRPLGTTNRSPVLREEIITRMERKKITARDIAEAMGCTRANVYAQLRAGTTPCGHRSIMEAMDEVEQARRAEQ